MSPEEGWRWKASARSFGSTATHYAGELKAVPLTQDTYSITSNLTNLSSSRTTLWSSGDGDYDTTLTADAGYLLPQTGESGDAAMCISLLLASGVGLAAAGIVRRRATAR